MTATRRFFLIASLSALAACAGKSKFKTYRGPEVTRVIINKGDRKMHLLHHRKALKSYMIDLGFEAVGHKQFEGDGRTPEGEYIIDRRNPNSKFHLSLGISYPNDEDIAYASSMGKAPGGDIFIHGRPSGTYDGSPDWTAGCISVRNPEMEDIYAMVRDGTPVTITP